VRVMDYGLRCELVQGGWSSLRYVDRPALIKLATNDADDGYAVVGGLDSELATLDLMTGSESVPIAVLDESWDGEYLILWQPPPVGTGVIGPSSIGEAVQWLRNLLSNVPELAVDASESGLYDQALREAVRRFQKLEGLETDGIAGPQTLIRLHNVLAMPEIPRLKPAP